MDRIYLEETIGIYLPIIRFLFYSFSELLKQNSVPNSQWPKTNTFCVHHFSYVVSNE